ncbi:hypothetical protein [Phenylobacterium sp.]|uniref:hypothetical protein n=1 Tax=Phenylobacterium sp. TaxID=1871053 RepID=UPI0012279998|nr:hypothetical protein [Phenylobacterium sp.]THD64707.1 MAG: hypothetical protein E8A49_01280 [Phenylobacterium sp.]
MSVAFTQPQPAPALVSRTEARPGAMASYLILSADGAADWTADPTQATAFASMREATRQAMRLPSSLKAYGLPRGAEGMVH